MFNSFVYIQSFLSFCAAIWILTYRITYSVFNDVYSGKLIFYYFYYENTQIYAEVERIIDYLPYIYHLASTVSFHFSGFICGQILNLLLYIFSFLDASSGSFSHMLCHCYSYCFWRYFETCFIYLTIISIAVL